MFWDHGKRKPIGALSSSCLTGVPIIHLWAIVDLGMGALVMVGRSLWVSLLVWTGGGGFHILCILTDDIRSVPFCYKMPFPVFNTKEVQLISFPLVKDTAYSFVNNVCRQIYSYTLGEGGWECGM